MITSFSLKGAGETCKYSARLEGMGAGNGSESCMHTWYQNSSTDKVSCYPQPVKLAGALSGKQSL